jgi:hypothetical protein
VIRRLQCGSGETRAFRWAGTGARHNHNIHSPVRSATFRCIVAGRRMILSVTCNPLHLAISKQWKIHYFSVDMRERAEHRAEEAKFLADMPEVLGGNAMAALERLSAALGLDYGGIDFALNQGGEILLFEANATMVVEQPDAHPRWDYRRAAVERIHAAVRDLLLLGAGALPCRIAAAPDLP